MHIHKNLTNSPDFLFLAIYIIYRGAIFTLVIVFLFIMKIRENTEQELGNVRCIIRGIRENVLG